MRNKKIIIYDFDGTLTPYPITRYAILEECGLSGTSDPILKEAIMGYRAKGFEEYAAIYSGFLDVIRDSGFELTDENISLGAEYLEYNKGAVEFMRDSFENGVTNYLLSSTIKVLLEKTCVADYFSEIYATTFKYDSNNRIIGFDYLMSDKKKVEIIEEIMRDNGLSDCRDVVYVGDGLTDLYAMEYVKKNGGISIFVYLDEKNNAIASAKEMDVVSFFALADYSVGSELNNYLSKICGIGE